MLALLVDVETWEIEYLRKLELAFNLSRVYNQKTSIDFRF